MNWDRIAGNWKQLKGKFQQRWAKLTDDELEKSRGEREVLEGRIQELYGVTRDEAKEQLRKFADAL